MFIQMEYCSGNTLHHQLQERTLIDRKWNFKFFSSILEGLIDVHQHDIVHRDLKPENIFIANGKAKIGDFGLSRSLVSEPQSFESKPSITNPSLSTRIPSTE